MRLIPKPSRRQTTSQSTMQLGKTHLAIHEGWEWTAPKSVSCLCALNRYTAKFIAVECQLGCEYIGRHPVAWGHEFLAARPKADYVYRQADPTLSKQHHSFFVTLAILTKMVL